MKETDCECITMTNEGLWEKYKDIYHKHEISISQTHIVTIVANEILTDFPKQMPEKIRKPLEDDLQHLAYCLSVNLDETEQHDAQKNFQGHDVRHSESADGFELFHSVLNLQMNRVMLYSKKESEIEFSNTLLSQELVMLMAHIDAFMGDTIRIICQAHPEILNRKKEIKWNTVLSCGNWDNLMDFMIEEYNYEFGRKSFNEQIQIIRTTFGIKLNYPRADEEFIFLEDMRNNRNAIVHNGGKVNEDFIKKSKNIDINIGELLPLDVGILNKVYGSVSVLAGELFLEVSKKFFDKDETSITGVWRREK